jgi:hypothetical protein
MKTRDEDDGLVKVYCKKCKAFLGEIIPGGEIGCRTCGIWGRAAGGHKWCKIHKGRYPENSQCKLCTSERVKKHRAKQTVARMTAKTPLQRPTDKGIAVATFDYSHAN